MHGKRAGAMRGWQAHVPRKLHRALYFGFTRTLMLLALVFLCAANTEAQPLSVDTAAIGNLLRSLDAPGATESATLYQTSEGYLRFVGAPQGGRFIPREDGNKSITPEGAAHTFVSDHGAAFGVVSDLVVFKDGGRQQYRNGEYVRLNQYYQDIPVYGAQVVVQLDENNRVRNIMSDIMRDTRSLDRGDLSLTPTISAIEAVASAINNFAARYNSLSPSDFRSVGTPVLRVYRPDVLGLTGATQLVWELSIAASGAEVVDEVVLVDAHSGLVSFHYSRLEYALERQIFDADFSLNIPDVPTRAEGDAPTGIAAVDDTYDFLEDTYNFYFNEHGYDSFDDAGGVLHATVNVPFLNACWGCSLDPGSQEEGSGLITQMLFGDGFAIDDIVAHELTHGVTQFTGEGLIYFGFSGAINESFSDIWGEFVDLGNGAGNDDESLRWRLAEDLPEEVLLAFGLDPNVPGFRDMKDPTIFGDPDRLGSPLLYDVESFVDNGGVHHNSGIGNKLCYLLTDGDTFNGVTVQGMGIGLVADLFFGTQYLLPPTADYNDLFLALGASSVDLNLTLEERLNITNAGKAVDIVPDFLFQTGLRDFRATATTKRTGESVIALKWRNPDAEVFSELTLLRSVAGPPTGFNDGVVIAEGNVDRYLDEDVSDGITYYYTLVADLSTGLPQLLSARATAGQADVDSLTEAFGLVANAAGGSPLDLSFSQLLFTPVGGPTNALGAAQGGGSFSSYEATITHDVISLPVAREDSDGGSQSFTPPQDQGEVLNFGGSFPFFGVPYTQAYAAANGYISFQRVDATDSLNFPTLESHFAIPRISYFFAGSTLLGNNLAPSAGGEMWGRLLDDRGVITYENIPQYRAEAPQVAGAVSTVQIELFYSGHIRITYLDASAVSAVIGLSDGRGVPVDPATLFPNVVSSGGLSDLSALPAVPSLLSIEPIAPPVVGAGDRVQFGVVVNNPAGSDGIPIITAQWNGPGNVPFGDNRDGTGNFNWSTTSADEGLYTFRVTAELDGQTAYQDVTIWVGFVLITPEAINLELSSNDPGEDPSQSRAVAVERALQASYEYFHPLAMGNGGIFDEGDSILYWFRNGQTVPGLTNRFLVAPQATNAGDEWFFAVVPVSSIGYAGAISYSPVVRIAGVPEVVSVNPALGGTAGGDTVRITGSRLSGVLSVTFGGVNVNSIRTISSTEIEVVTPMHSAGTVDVVVTSANGPGRQTNAYTYIGDGSSIQVVDVNNDGKIDALDVQLVVSAVLGFQNKSTLDADANRDGQLNSMDVQVVVNGALHR